MLGHTLKSHATTASGLLIWRSIPPRKFPAFSIARPALRDFSEF
jgi:hypothetical protein